MKGCLITISIVFFQLSIYCQDIQYSRQTVNPPIHDVIKLVADVDGFHHLLFFSNRKEPLIYIFDSKLQLNKKIELKTPLRNVSDIKIVSFKKKYLLYYKIARTSIHQLLMINSDGSIKNVSHILNSTNDTSWNRNGSGLQFFNISENLFLLSNFYFESAKKNILTVVSVDSTFAPQVIGHFSVPYDQSIDVVRRLFIYKNYLVVIKTTLSNDENNSIDFICIDLISGSTHNRSYAIGRPIAGAPSIIINKNESSFITYVTLYPPFDYKEQQPTILITKLDFNLREILPYNVLETQLSDSITSNFLTLKKEEIGWVKMSSDYAKSLFNRPDIFIDGRYLGFDFTDYFEKIRLTLMDTDLTSEQDTLLNIEEKYSQIRPTKFAEFVSNNIQYLIVGKTYSTNRIGLLLINPDYMGNIAVTDLRVFDRYDYYLSALNSIRNNCIVIPFGHKNQFGLIKICFSDR